MQHGFVFVDNTPFDDAVHTKRLLERIGPIRETHYGGFYDFVPDMAKADSAYSNIALPAHTDTTYFTDPAGLQAFHMLSHVAAPGTSEGARPTGGQSLLVDGFRAAKMLREEDPGSFASLSGLRVPWHASGNKGVTIASDETHPVILATSKKNRGQILRIRWNNDDRGGRLALVFSKFDSSVQLLRLATSFNQGSTTKDECSRNKALDSSPALQSVISHSTSNHADVCWVLQRFHYKSSKKMCWTGTELQPSGTRY